jgi:EAL domain-containing protein (putative c-di-GMP-specific phosphodiesterase class I)
LLARLSMSTRLRNALSRDEFELHYQPIFSLCDGRLAGVEALIRWREPDRGLVVPAEFISVAEDTGLIEAIGDWVIEAACRQALAWEEHGFTPEIAFNVSPRQLHQPNFCSVLRRRVLAHGVDPARLTVEITESTAMQDSDRIESVLRELRQFGLRIAIDDFGAGYSSLSRLRHMPVQVLKIDRSLMREVPRSEDASAVIGAIIQLARAVRADAVAEGVETEAQRRFLVDQACPLAQGFHLGRPVPGPELIAPTADSRPR